MLQRSLPDDTASERDAVRAKERAGPDQIVEPLLLDQPADGQHERRLLDPDPVRRESRQVDPVVDAEEASIGSDAREMAAVEVADRHREPCTAKLPRQVDVRDGAEIDVLCVGREAVGRPRQLLDVQGDGRRARGEVRVHVADPLPPYEPVR